MKGLLTLLMLAAIAAAVWYLPAKSRHHHFSETGVVYTTQYVTLNLPTGVVGFPPGTRMASRFDLHVSDEETVTDGKYTLALDPQTLTHDVEYAGMLAAADGANQDQARAQAEQANADHAASQHAGDLAHAEAVEQTNAVMVAASAVGNGNTNLGRTAAAWGTYASYGSAPVVYYSGGRTVNNVTVYASSGFAGTGAHTAAAQTTAAAATASHPAASRVRMGTNNSTAAHPAGTTAAY